MATVDETVLKKELANGKINNLYVICGQEPYLKDFYTEKIVKLAVDDGFEAFNLKRIDGTQADISDILAAGSQMPLMGDYNCCVIKDFPLIKLNSADCTAMTEFVQNIPDSSVIIFYSREESFPPKASKDNSDDSKDKKKNQKEMFAQFGKSACIAKLDRRKERDIVSLLCSGAKKRNAVLNPANASLMINLCGNDLYTLLNELEKVCIYSGGKEITGEMINKICIKTLEATAFEITDNLFSGNTDKALLSLKILLEQKTPAQMILGSLIFPFVDIYRIKTAEKYGKTTRDIMQSFSYSSSFRLDKAKRNGRNISENGIKKCLEILDFADMCLKSRSGNDGIILEQTLVKLRNEIC